MYTSSTRVKNAHDSKEIIFPGQGYPVRLPALRDREKGFFVLFCVGYTYVYSLEGLSQSHNPVYMDQSKSTGRVGRHAAQSGLSRTPAFLKNGCSRRWAALRGVVGWVGEKCVCVCGKPELWQKTKEGLAGEARARASACLPVGRGESPKRSPPQPGRLSSFSYPAVLFPLPLGGREARKRAGWLGSYAGKGGGDGRGGAVTAERVCEDDVGRGTGTRQADETRRRRRHRRRAGGRR